MSTVDIRTKCYSTSAAAMTVINALDEFHVRAVLEHKPELGARPWVVTVTRWPFSPTVRLVDYHDVEPHEDDFQESRQEDQDWYRLDMNYRRRHSLNDPD